MTPEEIEKIVNRVVEQAVERTVERMTKKMNNEKEVPPASDPLMDRLKNVFSSAKPFSPVQPDKSEEFLAELRAHFLENLDVNFRIERVRNEFRAVWEPQKKSLRKFLYDSNGKERDFLTICWAALTALVKERFIQLGQFAYQSRRRSSVNGKKKEKYYDWRWSKLSETVPPPVRKVGQAEFTA
jgi:hypothetical protein